MYCMYGNKIVGHTFDTHIEHSRYGFKCCLLHWTVSGGIHGQVRIHSLPKSQTAIIPGIHSHILYVWSHELCMCGISYVILSSILP